jgi:hypothetical protein
MDLQQLLKESRPFIGWLVNWYNHRPTLDMAQVIEQAGGPDRVAIMAVDVTHGFCYEGALSSKRVAHHTDRPSLYAPTSCVCHLSCRGHPRRTVGSAPPMRGRHDESVTVQESLTCHSRPLPLIEELGVQHRPGSWLGIPVTAYRSAIAALRATGRIHGQANAFHRRTGHPAHRRVTLTSRQKCELQYYSPPRRRCT